MSKKKSRHLYRDIYELLPENHRRGFKKLIFLMIVGMAMESMSIALVLPVVAFIMNPHSIDDYPRLKLFIEYIGVSSSSEYLHFIVLLLILMYFIKALTLTFISRYQIKFLLSMQSYSWNKLFEKYLYQQYSFHKYKKTSEMMSNIVNEVTLLTYNVLTPLLSLISESAILIGILSLLIIIEPIGTISVIIFVGAIAVVIKKIMKNKLSEWGEIRQKHDQLRVMRLQQGLNGVKEIKIFSMEENILNIFEEGNKPGIIAINNQLLLQSMPRIWFELIALAALLGVALVATMGRASETVEILPLLSLFGAASFRMLPSFTKIAQSIQSLKYCESTVLKIKEEFALPIARNIDINKELFEFKNSLDLDNISYTYKNRDDLAINGVKLKIKAGDVIGISGESGSGKSTLIDIVLGLLKPDGGKIRIDDVEVDLDNYYWKKKIGYIPQSIYLIDDSMRNNIIFGLKNGQISTSVLREVLKISCLEKFINDLPNGIETSVGENALGISGGQKQRIGIARALIHNPSIIILDEATSALDKETEFEVITNLLKYASNGKTVIIVSHNPEITKLCNRNLIIKNGNIEECCI